MKKLLLIALVVGGIAFATAPKTEAGTYLSVGIGFPIGFGYYGGGCYPGYYSGYYGGGYYPYTGYYRAYPYYGAGYRYYGHRYYGHRYSRSYYWHNGHRVYYASRYR